MEIFEHTEKKIKDELTIFLEKYEFRNPEDTFLFESDDIESDIFTRINIIFGSYKSNKYQLDYSIAFRNGYIEAFWDEYKAKLGLGTQKAFTCFFDFHQANEHVKVNIPRIEYFTQQEGEVEKVIAQFKKEVTEVIFPFLKTLKDIRFSDKLANTPPEKFWESPNIFNAGGHIFRKMILAKLAENSDFEKICLLAKEKIEENPVLKRKPERYQNYLNTYDQVISELNQI